MHKPSIAANKHIDYLDALRILAISGVVAFHYLFSAISRGRTPNLSFSPISEIARYGYLGVELFFMLSGFLIVQSVGDLTLIQFLKRRFFRLYPLYWLAIILIFVISTFGIWQRRGPTAETFYYNLTMFPTAFNQPWLDAAHWFMAKQLQFYLAIALILAVKMGKYLASILTWWSIIGAFWYLLHFDDFNIWYFNGFFALICGGAIINSIRIAGFSNFRVIGLLASYIWAMKSRIDKVHWLDTNRGEGHSGLIIGIVLTIIFLLLILTWIPKVSKLKIKGVIFLGSLSYPVYLVHDRLGGLAIARFANDNNKYLIYFLVVSSAILLALFIMRIEIKITNRFTSSSKPR